MKRKKRHFSNASPYASPYADKHNQVPETDNDSHLHESKFKVKGSDLKNVFPLTKNQEQFFNAFDKERKNAFIMHGVAGTGKTYIALYCAIKAVLDPSTPYKKVVIVRSAVPSRDIGHLPGNEKEKTEVYTQPYREILGDLFPKFGEKSFTKLKEQGYMDFMITSYVRGLTIDNSIVIVDEYQNANWNELNSVITRVGKNCKLIMCGDLRQNDLHNKKHDPSGLQKLMTIASHMEDTFECVEFDQHDILRSDFVKQFILATIKCEDLGLI